MQVPRRFQRRWAGWRADASYRRLFRAQVWEQRRRRLRWELRRQRHQFDGHSARLVVLVASVLLLTGVAGYAAIRPGGDTGNGTPSAEGTARTAADQSPSDKRPRRVPGRTMPGIYLLVAFTDVGQLEVAERARTGTQFEELSLAPPPAPAGSDGTPRLVDVQVSADGQPVPVPGTIEVATKVTLAVPATSIELRYRVVGAAARSEPAPPGRATLSLRPALASTFRDGRVVVDVRGTDVHNLVCVDLRAPAQLCGVDRGDGWRTRRLPVASSAVIALVDLPDPAA